VFYVKIIYNTPSHSDIDNHKCDKVSSVSSNEAESDCGPGTNGTLWCKQS
jgi:hypothetical protein